MLGRWQGIDNPNVDYIIFSEDNSHFLYVERGCWGTWGTVLHQDYIRAEIGH